MIKGVGGALSEKENKLQQPVRITLAIVLWGLILWVLTLGVPALVPMAKAIFIVAVLPSGLVEWLRYKGLVGENRSAVAKILLMIVAALLWYFGYR
jgi:predicted PurR-regulated permease PerM